MLFELQLLDLQAICLKIHSLINILLSYIYFFTLVSFLRCSGKSIKSEYLAIFQRKNGLKDYSVMQLSKDHLDERNRSIMQQQRRHGDIRKDSYSFPTVDSCLLSVLGKEKNHSHDIITAIPCLLFLHLIRGESAVGNDGTLWKHVCFPMDNLFMSVASKWALIVLRNAPLLTFCFPQGRPRTTSFPLWDILLFHFWQPHLVSLKV